MPPMVARDEVDTSGGKKRPCARNAWFNWSSTTPGSYGALVIRGGPDRAV